MSYYGFPEYVPVAQKRAKAARKVQQLRKKNPNIQPVVIQGNAIARTWWGKSWNRNLERYADYSNRIGRGRSYVRHGAVLDLQIKPGKIKALVQGTQPGPYAIDISITALAKNTWKNVRETAQGQLDSLSELLAGQFPKPLQELFFDRKKGLFPAPKEIRFSCSCPDWAYMCKHVAAVLYGVGARLDENPSLFFDLRRLKIDDLIAQAVKSTTRTLLKKAKTKSTRVMEDADLTDVFGIELDSPIPASKDTTKRGKKGRSGKKRPAAKTAISKTAASKPTKKAAKRKIPATGTIVDRVVAAIGRRRKGMRVAEVCTRTDLSEQQVRSAVARAVAQGKVSAIERGLYIKI